ncbi:hypothetical protein MBGDF03_01185 [Thermoplasmatales archaeon SCGC AB-540-F20]|nr:hypothetical protein MBGDF03_01185 [Thermoplasmatales archaeon SCGC AB-540-F20]
MKKEARFWKSIGNNKVQCFLCPHNCKINVDERGVCGVRKNEDGKLYSLIYSSCSSVAEDPIEKKTFYTIFYPGHLSKILENGRKTACIAGAFFYFY